MLDLACVWRSKVSENKLRPTASRCLRKSSIRAAADSTEYLSLFIPGESKVTSEG